MTLSKKQREQLLKQHCGVINDDDAIDPRHYFYNKRKHNRKYRKVFQLCRQVNDTLQMVLTDGNEKVDGLTIVDVVPAPDSRRMLVILGLDPGTVVKRLLKWSRSWNSFSSKRRDSEPKSLVRSTVRKLRIWYLKSPRFHSGRIESRRS